MFTWLDEDLPPKRTHPWAFAEGRPDLIYYDFKKNPEKIREVLEDFKPLEHYPAIQKYYDLLEWLNGESSIFETNDCTLSQLEIHQDPPPMIPLVSPIGIHGRLTIIYRNLELNTQETDIDWLSGSLLRVLSAIPKFHAVVKIGLWQHRFTAIGKAGNAISLRFWAWGSDEDQAMTNLGGVFEALHKTLRALSMRHARQSQGM